MHGDPAAGIIVHNGRVSVTIDWAFAGHHPENKSFGGLWGGQYSNGMTRLIAMRIKKVLMKLESAGVTVAETLAEILISIK